jgi:hypothetical protein
MTTVRLRDRLSQVSTAVAPPAEPPAPAVPARHDEAEELGAEAGAAFCQVAELYRDQRPGKLTPKL